MTTKQTQQSTSLLSGLMDKLSLLTDSQTPTSPTVAMSTTTPAVDTAAKVGIIYDADMCDHYCREDRGHPESPRRITKCYERLQSLIGVDSDSDTVNSDSNNRDNQRRRLTEVKSRSATREEILRCHRPALFDKLAAAKTDLELAKLQSEYNSFYMNSATFRAALLAAGCVIEMADQVVSGRLQHGLAVVRPPGHHAEANAAMGFCAFNNVAVAAEAMRARYSLKRIAIVDWDVHHGNGTQHMFYDSQEIMYISLHRHDGATFYPCSRDADADKVGSGAGAGYNINLAFETRADKRTGHRPRIGDNEYAYTFDTVINPILTAYQPQLILVSAGFDCAEGDPLGGLKVSPYGFRYMTYCLAKLAPTVVALEGGYNVDAVANSMLACAETLLAYSGSDQSIVPMKFMATAAPDPQTVKDVESTRSYLRPYWDCLI